MYKDNAGVWQVETYRIIDSKQPADIVSLYEDKYGFIWIGSLGEGVFRFNPVTGKARRFNEKTNIEESSILSITGDGDEIWAGTNPLDSYDDYGYGGGGYDFDGDGLSDDDERYVFGTDLNLYDTDGGGLGDGEEVWSGRNPLDPSDDWY